MLNWIIKYIISIFTNLYIYVYVEIRFLHPFTYGEYPRRMQEIVKERLPKFSEEEVKKVKGSVDFVGINQYTTFYMFNPTWPKPTTPGYQSDWHVGYACKTLLHHCYYYNYLIIFFTSIISIF